jgi:hypothetical protein
MYRPLRTFSEKADAMDDANWNSDVKDRRWETRRNLLAHRAGTWMVAFGNTQRINTIWAGKLGRLVRKGDR